jgi:hypothetical protein
MDDEEGQKESERCDFRRNQIIDTGSPSKE